MSRRWRSSSSIGTRGSESEDSLRSDNLHVSLSLSPSNFQKIVRPLVSRKVKFLPKKATKRMSIIAKSKASPRTGLATSGIPEDVAVHFGNFYSLGEESRKTAAGFRDGGINKTEFPARTEFTRQMVHKLERLAGTEYYARQVSALLEDTVESPNFAVKPPPADNFLPYERSEPMAYPLWYKEPDKTTSRSREYSTSSEHRAKRANGPTKETQSGECLTSSANSGSRRFADVTDCESNDESSSTSSDQSISDANTEEDNDYNDVKVSLLSVK